MDERTITIRDSPARHAPAGPESPAEQPAGAGPYTV
jgi:hypothetical protein